MPKTGSEKLMDTAFEKNAKLERARQAAAKATVKPRRKAKTAAPRTIIHRIAKQARLIAEKGEPVTDRALLRAGIPPADLETYGDQAMAHLRRTRPALARLAEGQAA